MILEVIKQLEEASGNQKIQILKDNDNGILRHILESACNPFISYGIKDLELEDIPVAQPHATPFSKFFENLFYLKTKAMKGKEARKVIVNCLAASGEYKELFHRVLMKDLRCGLKVKTINKAFPGLIPEYEVMLANTYTVGIQLNFPVYIDTKHDGIRATAFCHPNKETVLITRAGNLIPGHTKIKAELHSWAQEAGKPLEIDGELMIGMFGLRKEKLVNFICFDLIREGPLKDRLEELAYLMHKNPCDLIKVSEGWVVKSLDELEALYRSLLAQGAEGVVIKDLAGPYERKRSKYWLKYKPVLDVDLPITGYYAGKGKYKGSLGGFTVEHKGKHVRVPSGKGIDMTRRHELWTNRDKLIGEILEIQYLEVTPAGSLRHPRFVKVRYDK